MIKKWSSQEEASFAWQRLCESFRSFPQGLNFWGKCEMSSEVQSMVPTKSSVKVANKHEVSVTGWGHQLCWLNMSLQRCTLTTNSQRAFKNLPLLHNSVGTCCSPSWGGPRVSCVTDAWQCRPLSRAVPCLSNMCPANVWALSSLLPML